MNRTGAMYESGNATTFGTLYSISFRGNSYFCFIVIVSYPYDLYVHVVCQWLATGRWFSPGGTSVSSTNKTDHHDITEILLTVALNTINPNLYVHVSQSL